MKEFTLQEAKDIAQQLGVDFDKVAFTPEEYLEGLNIELEHGSVDSDTNVTNDDDLLATAKDRTCAFEREYRSTTTMISGLEAWEHLLEAFDGDPKGKKIVIVDAD